MQSFVILSIRKAHFQGSVKELRAPDTVKHLLWKNFAIQLCVPHFRTFSLLQWSSLVKRCHQRSQVHI